MSFKCFHPLTLNRGTKSQPVWQDVPCGKCPACLARRRSDWFIRLLSEYRASKTCVFFTLTYDDEHYPKDSSLSRADVTNFVRRVKRLAQKQGYIAPRYFIAGEYGSTSYRAHYHGFFFDLPQSWQGVDFYARKIESLWQNGFVTCDPPSNARFNYVVKYCLALSEEFFGRRKPFVVCNRRPPIGSVFLSPAMVQYVRSHADDLLDYQGYKRPLPRFYYNKIFTEEERRRRSFLNRKLKSQEFSDRFDDFEDLGRDAANKKHSLIHEYRTQQELTQLKSVKKTKL